MGSEFSFCSAEPEEIINPNFIDQTHFNFMKVVGKGAFGKVNAATDKVKGKLIAIKRINKRRMLTKDPKLKSINMEIYVMTRVKGHFNLKLYCIFQNQYELGIVMPFLRGGDLRYYLRMNGPMTEYGAKFYAAEILLGLKELHSLKIVHRDLKPENLMFRENGHIVITDYGISKKLGYSLYTFGRAGTSGYAAPEVDYKEYSYSCDIFTFAVILYEFVSCHRPSFPDVSYNGISETCADLLKSIFILEPVEQRLGGGQSVQAVMDHKFFEGTDWEGLSKLSIPAPFIPNADVANCSNDTALEEALLGNDESDPLTEAEQNRFANLTYRDSLRRKSGKDNKNLDTAAASSTPGPNDLDEGPSSPRSVMDFISDEEKYDDDFLISPLSNSHGKTWSPIEITISENQIVENVKA